MDPNTETAQLAVKVHQEGDWWVADIPSLDQVTQAQTRAELEDAVREVASLVTGRPAEDFTIRTQ